jgi:hypothetical protein
MIAHSILFVKSFVHQVQHQIMSYQLVIEWSLALYEYRKWLVVQTMEYAHVYLQQLPQAISHHIIHCEPTIALRIANGIP